MKFIIKSLNKNGIPNEFLHPAIETQKSNTTTAIKLKCRGTKCNHNRTPRQWKDTGDRAGLALTPAVCTPAHSHHYVFSATPYSTTSTDFKSSKISYRTKKGRKLTIQSHKAGWWGTCHWVPAPLGFSAGWSRQVVWKKRKPYEFKSSMHFHLSGMMKWPRTLFILAV